jgi:hypothetical protein
MRGLSAINQRTTQETVKDPLLSRFCLHYFSSPQKFISWKWINYGRMKLLLRESGRAS